VKFLGVEISLTWIRIQDKKVAGFKAKVKAITRRNSPVNLEQVISDLTPVLRVFANYFRMANCKGVFLRDYVVDSTAVTRQAACIVETRRSPYIGRLRQLGYQGDFPKMAMRRWRSFAEPPG